MHQRDLNELINRSYDEGYRAGLAKASPELRALAQAVVDAEDTYMNAQSHEDIGAGAAQSEKATDALRLYLAGTEATR